MHLGEYEVLVRIGFLLHVDVEFFYFDSFGVEHVPEQTEKIIGQKKHKNKHITNLHKQFNNVCLFLHWIHWFYVFMFAGKTLIDYSSLFFPYNVKKDDNIISDNF